MLLPHLKQADSDVIAGWMRAWQSSTSNEVVAITVKYGVSME